MIEGPTDSSGAPGLRDGRIDALLDKGAYKIRVANAKGAARQGAAVGGALRRGRRRDSGSCRGTDAKRRTRRFAATELCARCRAGGPRRDRGRGARPRRHAALAPRRRIGRSRLRAAQCRTQARPVHDADPAGGRAGAGPLPRHRLRRRAAGLGERRDRATVSVAPRELDLARRGSVRGRDRPLRFAAVRGAGRL